MRIKANSPPSTTEESAARDAAMRVDHDDLIGRTLGGYRIISELGRGGMGVVYRAHEAALDRTVAVKILSASMATDGEIREQFQREALAAARLNHPNLVTIHSISLEHDPPFIAMEYVDGTELSGLIEAEGRLDPHAAVKIGIQVAGALAAAHEHGIIHGDIKPQNIMVDATGRVRVLDFGIARITDTANAPTETRAKGSPVVGTPAFMAPEQCRGDDAGPESDVHALGAVLYTMLRGKLPFRGESSREILKEILYEPHASLDETVEDLPEGLSAIVDRAMAKDLGDRYSNGAGIQAELRELFNRIQLRASLLQAQTEIVYPESEDEELAEHAAAAISGKANGRARTEALTPLSRLMQLWRLRQLRPYRAMGAAVAGLAAMLALVLFVEGEGEGDGAVDLRRQSNATAMSPASSALPDIAQTEWASDRAIPVKSAQSARADAPENVINRAEPVSTLPTVQTAPDAEEDAEASGEADAESIAREAGAGEPSKSPASLESGTSNSLRSNREETATAVRPADKPADQFAAARNARDVSKARRIANARAERDRSRPGVRAMSQVQVRQLDKALEMLTGSGGTVDENQAREHLERIAAAGHPMARMWLAWLRHWGRAGVAADPETAARDAAAVIGDIRHLAEFGNARAMFLLGAAYDQGIGIEPDPAAGYEWVRRADKAGAIEASNYLGWMRIEGRGARADAIAAVDHFRQGAARGDTGAMHNLGLMYSSGYGVERDYVQALKWFRRGAEAGSPRNMNDLAWMYETGRGVEADPDEALYWIERAARAGDPRAMYNLASRYETGHGIEQTRDRAIYWYRRAAQMGSKDAKKKLASAARNK